jgi:hypothetical protein
MSSRSHEVLGLGPESTKFRIVTLMLIHPDDGFAVPFAGDILIAQFPVCHGQEEPIDTVTALAEFHSLGERCDRFLPACHPVVCDTERVPVCALLVQRL